MSDHNSHQERHERHTDNDSPEGDEPLFRRQVFEEQQSQWLGKVLIASSLSHVLFTAFALLASAAVIALLFFGSYTRKEQINGWLVPQLGMVQVFTPLSGVITDLSVRDGADVQHGDVLLTVSTEVQSEARGATQGEIIDRLQRRRDSLMAERPLLIELFEQKVRSLKRRIQKATEERVLREQELVIFEDRIAFAGQVAERLESARKNGSVSEITWLDAENDRLDQVMRERQLMLELSAKARELDNLQAELDALPYEHRKQLAENDRAVDTLEQQLAEAESRRQIVLTAPQSGTVAAMQLEQGNSVKSDLPVMSIIPAGSELEAQLYLPTRAIGFIEVGQPVLLRYRAFPYQKFGHYKGTIAEVSPSTVNLQDLSAQQRGGIDPMTANEPVYPVKVRLLSQTVNAYGRNISLQPGMELEADVLIEKRSLIEWVLEPLYTLTGRMSA